MKEYTEINSKEVLQRVYEFLGRTVEKYENQGNTRLARAFLIRKQQVWNRLQKVERGELNGRKRKRGVSDKDTKGKRRSSST